jgi:hypothetical protein
MCFCAVFYRKLLIPGWLFLAAQLHSRKNADFGLRLARGRRGVDDGLGWLRRCCAWLLRSAAVSHTALYLLVCANEGIFSANTCGGADAFGLRQGLLAAVKRNSSRHRDRTAKARRRRISKGGVAIPARCFLRPTIAHEWGNPPWENVCSQNRPSRSAKAVRWRRRSSVMQCPLLY